MQGKKIDEATCQKVIDLWMNHNCTQHEIVERMDISDYSVRRIINEYTSTGAHAPDKAVTAEPEQIEQVTEPVPEAILDAVTSHIMHLENIVACNLDKIRTLQCDNEEYRTKIANMRTWLAEVDT